MLRQRRIRRHKGPLSFMQSLLLSFIIFLLFTVQSLWIIHKGIKPTLLEIANLETQKIATSAINYAVADTIERTNMNELIDINYNNKGDVKTIGFNPKVYNTIHSSAVASVQEYLKRMETDSLSELDLPENIDVGPELENGIVYSIPLGRATNNVLLAQLGPKVPVKLSAIGDVDVDLQEKYENVGINNTWIRVSMNLIVDVNVIIPFATDTDTVKTSIPLGMMYVPGDVPQFYNSGEDADVSVPTK
ncbi:sporulation protein YunB [Metabacillus arenae]|uniref:Sporulation protein YunB n=1 Tax=Metabacillus arenae TaxID=2771434 RepID=A0A926NJ08_9BACI|nr:sporulation protein YunB [Metabacillus arenae]MBD1381418.1 sporulation protein YunB [Metabacillus arenae]